MKKINESSVTARDWAALQEAIDGEVALPDSPVYERVVKPFNAWFHDVQPRVMILCATPQDVAETISFLDGFRAN